MAKEPNGRHPDAAKLRAFAVGKLAGTELDKIARHLEQCEQCLETAFNGDWLEDSFLKRLRENDAPAEPNKPSEEANAVPTVRQASILEKLWDWLR